MPDKTGPFSQGDDTITWTFTDSKGNHSSQTQAVHVHDTTAPVADAMSLADVTGQCSANLPAAPTATDACDGLITGVPDKTGPFGQGDDTITWTFTDSKGNHSSQTQAVHVHDTIAPVLNVPANVTINTAVDATSCTAFVSNSLLTATASDNCGVDSNSFTRSGVPAGNNFPVGMTIVTYTVKDINGNMTTGTQSVTVMDATLPVITLTGRIITLWPPDHKYVNVKLTDLVAAATDNCDSNVNLSKVVISQVTSDEPENINSGDGNTLNDMVIATDCKSVDLRAERDGSKNGRVYRIYFQVKDSAGNVRTVTAKVTVPKSQGPNGAAVDDTPALPAPPPYGVMGSCQP